MKNVENFQNFQNNNPELQSFEEKLNFNKSRFKKELNEGLKDKIKINVEIDDTIEKIKAMGEKCTIENFLTLDNDNYNLIVGKNGNDFSLNIFGEKGEKFNTHRSNNDNIAGWTSQGDYTFGTFDEYTSKDHWGVSVAEELKNTGLSDVLYDLKSLLNNQLEFEHVYGGTFNFLTFYIKKGYVPYSLIEANNSFEEKLINNDGMEKIIQEIKDSRKLNKELPEKDYAIKLKLDPKSALEIYNKITSS